MKSLAVYVTLEPETDEVSEKEQSVILTGVLKPIVMR
jgi:hypothetical protein